MKRRFTVCQLSLFFQDGVSNYTAAASELCGDTSTLSENISGSQNSMSLHAQFRAQVTFLIKDVI